MKIKILFIFSSIFIISSFLSAENLVWNSSCEIDNDRDGMPDGWQRGVDIDKERPFQVYNPYPVEGIVKQVKGISHNGECSIGYYSKNYGKGNEEMRVENWFDFTYWEKNFSLPKTDTCAVVLLSPFFPFESGKKYHISLWTKGVNASDLLIHIATYNEKKECISAYSYWLRVPGQAGAFKSGTWDWEEWSNEIKVGIKDAKYGRIFAWYREWGENQSFYLDDLFVEEIH